MCVSAISIGQSPLFPLVIAHNRDEFRSRTFTPLSEIRINANLTVYGGLDHKSQGMWFGVTNTRKLGFITNIRDLSRQKVGAPSRGFVVKDYLCGDLSPEEYVASLSNRVKELNPFNLILGDSRQLYYWNSDQKVLIKLPPGVYGLSNGFLDAPWPKVVKLKDGLTELMQKLLGPDLENLELELLKLLLDKTTYNLKDLPITGLSPEKESALSSIFVDTPAYGTLTSSLFILDHKDSAVITEYHHQKHKRKRIFV